MSALSAANAALVVRDSVSRTLAVKASTAVYMNSFVMRDSTGNIIPLSTAAGTFEGICPSGHTTTSTPRLAEVGRKGYFKGIITSIALTDIGKPVYCTTDNPADVTLTWSSGAKLVGWVSGLVYGPQSAAVSNECWVYFDADVIQQAETLEVVATAQTMDATTVDALGYVVPVGKKAKVLAGKWEVGPIAPDHVTTVSLSVVKISGTTRTTVVPAINIKSYATVDQTVAMTLHTTAANLALAAGDRLVASVICGGAATNQSSVKVCLTTEETPV